MEQFLGCVHLLGNDKRQEWRFQRYTIRYTSIITDSDKPSLLCVLIDLSTNLLDKFLPNTSIDKADLVEANSLQTFLLQVATFLNLFLVSDFGNRLVVLVYDEHDVQVVYEDKSLKTLCDQPSSATVLLTEERQERLTFVDSEILRNVTNFIDLQPHDSCVETLLSAALSFALCYIHRRIVSAPYDARILCLHASADVPQQYIGVMNSIFCAQRCNILIDVCNLHEEDSSLLQQAAYLTGGIYYKPRQCEPISLLNYLCNLYLSNRDSRKYLKLPVMDNVDCSAICFESGEKIQMGYVCSVCLATFGRKQTLCSICGSEFSDNDSARHG